MGENKENGPRSSRGPFAISNRSSRSSRPLRLIFGARTRKTSWEDGLVEALLRFVPAEDVPPGGHVIRPAVLVFQIIGVFPYIKAEDRLLAFHDRVILVGGGEDGELAAIL